MASPRGRLPAPQHHGNKGGWGHLASLGPLKVPAVEVNRFPCGSGGLGPSGSTAELYTRCQPQQKSGGAAGTLSHSLAPREGRGSRGRPRSRFRGKSEAEGREGVERKEEGRESQGKEKLDRGREECQGQRGRVPGLELGHGGSLRASRVFTNEGSKKEKRGRKGRPIPCWEKFSSSPPQQGGRQE